ncbi:hypothetical protein ARAM_006715 [Aspergillus rambellii]|uniref:High osmolarity sensitivity protein 3 n=1 Tax=Aspergillus rambellii TaxID=308745 RepID=A0A0F8UN37_9EURO|nr:hypothetical protein ARAM_006715 [Aspergillus rambellii]
MPPSHHHQHTTSQSFPRHSILPSSSSSSSSLNPNMNSSSSSFSNANASSMSATKTRQYAHLHSQLAVLNAHLADTENLLRMTAVQAEDMRFLGGYVGALFMGSAKVLGEEGVKGKGKEREREREDEEDGEEEEEEK